MNSAMVELNAVVIPPGFNIMHHLTGRDLLLMTNVTVTEIYGMLVNSSSTSIHFNMVRNINFCYLCYVFLFSFQH